MNKTFRVLAVEDDADTLQLMRLALKDLPLEIVAAATGSEAVAYLAAQVPDLMFLDLNLPDMRGWEVLDRFKTDPRLAHSAVMVLTSQQDPVHRVISMLQPVSVFVRKPFKPDELRHHVRQLLRLA